VTLEMLWVTSAASDRLLVKVCRLAEAHAWLTARGAMVAWLAGRDVPVATPVRSLDGDQQLLCDGRSVGVQPVLAGELLNTDDLDQVRAAGSILARMHIELAHWPDAGLLVDVLPVAGANRLWVYRAGHIDRVPADLQARLERRIVDLPELPQQPVHADFRGANILYQQREISAVLDFEEARIDAAVVDLAHALCLLGTWYHDWQPISPQASGCFWKATPQVDR
jgi:homoserine kinase type II